MDPERERERAAVGARDVELVGPLVALRVAGGAAEEGAHLLARLELHLADLRVDECDARQRELYRRLVAKDLLVGGTCEGRVGAQRGELLTVLQHREDGRRDVVARVVVRRADQGGCRGEQLVLGEAAVGARGDETVHDVAAVAVVLRDEGTEVLAEPGGRVVGVAHHVLGADRVYRLDEAFRPRAALVLIGVAHAAEELAHDGDGNVLGKVGDEVATAVRGHAVEQPVDEGLCVRAAGVDRREA